MILASSLQPLPAVSGSTPIARRSITCASPSPTAATSAASTACPSNSRPGRRARKSSPTRKFSPSSRSPCERGLQAFSRHRRRAAAAARHRPLSSRELIRTPGVETVQLTTNGTRLPRARREIFAAAACSRLNISLDALDPDRYRDITHGEVAPVLAGIRPRQVARLSLDQAQHRPDPP